MPSANRKADGVRDEGTSEGYSIADTRAQFGLRTSRVKVGVQDQWPLEEAPQVGRERVHVTNTECAGQWRLTQFQLCDTIAGVSMFKGPFDFPPYPE